MLKILITKKDFDLLSPELQKEYTQTPGNEDEFLLEQDDTSFKAQLGEFRNNNIRLIKEKATLEEDAKRFKDIDPDKYNEAQRKLAELEDKKLIEEGDVEALVENRTQRMKADHQGQVTALNTKLEGITTEHANLENQLSRVLIDSTAQQAVTIVGAVRKGAMTDILSRARGVFQLQEGVPVPIGADGNVLYGADGKSPLSIEEWAKGLTDEAPYLFEGTKGGGGQGSDKNNPPGNKGQIDANDKEAFATNLEDIASGKIKVVAQ